MQGKTKLKNNKIFTQYKNIQFYDKYKKIFLNDINLKREDVFLLSSKCLKTFSI